MTRNFEKPGRSLAFGTNAMAATSHPASTLTAIEIMKAGGNAWMPQSRPVRCSRSLKPDRPA